MESARERRKCCFLASRGSASDGVVPGVVIGETHGRGAESSFSCAKVGVPTEPFDVLGSLYDRLEKGVSTVLARLVAEEAVVLHKLGAELPVFEVLSGVVGIEE
jgi:hypothetical protein